MKVQLVSDVHLEFKPHHVVNRGAEVLVLCGDICVAETLHDSPQGLKALRYRDFFVEVSHSFGHVVYVLGNHEHYHGKVDCSVGYLRAALQSWGISNIHVLEQDVFKLGNVVFLGGTLWTDMNRGDPLTLYHLKSNMNDFKVTRVQGSGYRLWTPEQAAVCHKRTLEYFKVVLDLSREQKVVVLTHHAPSSQSIDERFAHDTLMNGGYCSELGEFVLDHPQIVTWCHGHMHSFSDYRIGTTRVLCNPVGYPGERTYSDLIFEV